MTSPHWGGPKYNGAEEARLFFLLSSESKDLNKTLTNLLAAPLGMREFFLGKIAAVFLATYVLGLVGFVISGAIVWFKFGELPSAQAFLATLVTIPIWGIVLSELLGLAYILFGNPFILRLVMILVMVALLSLVLLVSSAFRRSRPPCSSRLGSG